MTLRIVPEVREDGSTIRLIGHMRAEHVEHVRAELTVNRAPMALDLDELRLADLDAIRFLAAAEPDARTPAAALLDSGVGPAARSLELVVVTSRIEPALFSRLLERALTRRPVALVHVDAGSFAGGRRRPEPGLLRLQAAGVPVAVVRRGEDLAEALRGARGAEVAHA